LVSLIRREVQSAYDNFKPRITAVMVDTKASEKFFTLRDNQACNPMGGTVVMGTVTEGNDWFMMSQNGNPQKTSVPSHYKLLAIS
jgi:hypothetical protein